MNDFLFVATFDGKVQALDISSNKPGILWQEQISDHSFTTDLAGNKNGILASGGKMLESVPAIYGNKVYALITNGYLYAIE